MSAFELTFGAAPEVVAEAPGRVNLVGEHTDYNDGFVLPTAIPLRTRVEASRADGDAVDVATTAHVSPPRATYDLGAEWRRGAWTDYVMGVTATLRARGFALRGFRAHIASTVPLGGGLSSSASLLVGLVRALRSLFALDLDDRAVADVAHAAEHDFVGAPVGVMDTLAASLADEHTALFLDARSLTFERVALPPNAALLVVDSGVAHQHATGDYRTRRAECEQAAEALGVASLRALTLADLPAASHLPPPLDRRVRHVVTENQRVHDAVAAMRAGDLAALGEVFTASHRSQRDDYEVSVPAVDALVADASSQPGVYGARLTGGGFGGAVVALVARGEEGRVGRALEASARRDGREGVRVLVPAAGEE